jgi:hypothetical protein
MFSASFRTSSFLELWVMIQTWVVEPSDGLNCQDNEVHGFTVSTVNFNDGKNELGEDEKLCLYFILNMFLL